MNNYLYIFIKGSISVIYIFLVIKILGKKQISELNIFDYIIGLTLGNLAAEMTINSDIKIMEGLLSMTIYGLFSLFVSFITEKSIIARRFITGEPVIIIEKGKISKDQLKKCKIDINDLLQDARESGYFNINEINYAIMEPSGKISFLSWLRVSAFEYKDKDFIFNTKYKIILLIRRRRRKKYEKISNCWCISSSRCNACAWCVCCD